MISSCLEDSMIDSSSPYEHRRKKKVSKFLRRNINAISNDGINR